MSDDRIEGFVDEVARGMTAGEPSGAFRARVLARIAEAPRRSRRAATIAWPALAAAALVVALLVHRDTRPTVRLKPDTTAATAATAAPTVTSVVQPFRAAVTPRARTGRTGRVAIAPSPADALAPAPLSVESVAVAPIDAGDVAGVLPIDPQPLDTIPPIALAPIGDEGDRR